MIIDGIGVREVSTRALSWMAIYGAFGDFFVLRDCHDFVATFLLNNANLEHDFSKSSYLPRYDLDVQDLTRQVSVPMNDALVLWGQDPRLYTESNHSVISASPGRDDEQQLFISKLGLNSAFLHFLPDVAAYYHCSKITHVQQADDYSLTTYSGF